MMKITLLACTLLLGSMAAALASGTYIPPVGRIPGKRAGATDSALYALGQKTFEGKMMAAGAGDASSQKAKLMSLQAKVPASSNTDLTKLAGKITSEQVNALEYFIAKRFGM
jgi:hypothetical protein